MFADLTKLTVGSTGAVKGRWDERVGRSTAARAAGWSAFRGGCHRERAGKSTRAQRVSAATFPAEPQAGRVYFLRHGVHRASGARHHGAGLRNRPGFRAASRAQAPAPDGSGEEREPFGPCGIGRAAARADRAAGPKLGDVSAWRNRDVVKRAYRTAVQESYSTLARAGPDGGDRAGTLLAVRWRPFLRARLRSKRGTELRERWLTAVGPGGVPTAALVIVEHGPSPGWRPWSTKAGSCWRNGRKLGDGPHRTTCSPARRFAASFIGGSARRRRRFTP